MNKFTVSLLSFTTIIDALKEKLDNLLLNQAEEMFPSDDARSLMLRAKYGVSCPSDKYKIYVQRELPGGEAANTTCYEDCKYLYQSECGEAKWTQTGKDACHWKDTENVVIRKGNIVEKGDCFSN
jgi:hypothetical protein